MSPKPTSRDAIQPIDSQQTYPLAVFMRASGLGRHSMRVARKRGLRVIRIGGRAFVRGADFADFLTAVADQRRSANQAIVLLATTAEAPMQSGGAR
jgi:hypothetical protein